MKVRRSKGLTLAPFWMRATVLQTPFTPTWLKDVVESAMAIDHSAWSRRQMRNEPNRPVGSSNEEWINREFKSVEVVEFLHQSRPPAKHVWLECRVSTRIYLGTLLSWVEESSPIEALGDEYDGATKVDLNGARTSILPQEVPGPILVPNAFAVVDLDPPDDIDGWAISRTWVAVNEGPRVASLVGESTWRVQPVIKRDRRLPFTTFIKKDAKRLFGLDSCKTSVNDHARLYAKALAAIERGEAELKERKPGWILRAKRG